MNPQFEVEVKHLNKLIVEQSSAVESAVRCSLRSITEQNADLAIDIIDRDDIIDQMEVYIEEECLKILALHQPVASDLRYIVTLLKVNGELERIGDMAVNIAQRALHLADLNDRSQAPDFESMCKTVSAALKSSLDAFLTKNCYLASQVIRDDDIIDTMHRDNFKKISQLIKNTPDNTDLYIDFLSVSRNLERIGDCCTNIGEDVLYFLQGKIVRHTR